MRAQNLNRPALHTLDSLFRAWTTDDNQRLVIQLCRSSRIRVMPRRITSKTHDRARASGIGIAIAMCTLADGPDSAVVPLEGGVRQAMASPGHHTVDMAHQHVVEVDERGEPRPVQQLAPAR